MITFELEVKSATGQKVKATLKAPDVDTARKQITHRYPGFKVLSLKPAK